MPIKSQIKISEADLKTIYKEDYALFADKIITKDKKSKNEISGLASFILGLLAGLFQIPFSFDGS